MGFLAEFKRKYRRYSELSSMSSKLRETKDITSWDCTAERFYGEEKEVWAGYKEVLKSVHSNSEYLWLRIGRTVEGDRLLYTLISKNINLLDSFLYSRGEMGVSIFHKNMIESINELNVVLKEMVDSYQNESSLQLKEEVEISKLMRERREDIIEFLKQSNAINKGDN